MQIWQLCKLKESSLSCYYWRENQLLYQIPNFLMLQNSNDLFKQRSWEWLTLTPEDFPWTTLGLRSWSESWQWTDLTKTIAKSKYNKRRKKVWWNILCSSIQNTTFYIFTEGISHGCNFYASHIDKPDKFASHIFSNHFISRQGPLPYSFSGLFF